MADSTIYQNDPRSAGAVGALYVDNGDGTYSPEVAPFGCVPALYRYAFYRATGSDATLTGYFVDSSGKQITALQTFTITNSATTLTALYAAANTGAPLPTGAVGFLGALAGSAIYVGLGGVAAGTITAGMNPGAGYPQITISSNIGFGRVPK